MIGIWLTPLGIYCHLRNVTVTMSFPADNDPSIFLGDAMPFYVTSWSFASTQAHYIEQNFLLSNTLTQSISSLEKSNPNYADT